MQHSSAGQPRVRSGKQMVAKGKENNSVSGVSNRWQNRGFANSRNMTDQRIEVSYKGIQSRFYLFGEKTNIFSIGSSLDNSTEIVL